jgi:hypothetical protein
MPQVLRSRRTVLVLPVVLLLALAFGLSNASAASTTTTFTGTVLVTNFLNPGVETPGSPCPSAATDPANTVCGHAQYTAPGNGSVHACVNGAPVETVPGANSDPLGQTDLDLFVVSPVPTVLNPGNTIAAATGSTLPDCTDFTVTAGQTVELQVNPAFVVGPTNYTITVTFTPAATATSSCFKGRHMASHSKDEHEGRHREQHSHFEDDHDGGRKEHDKYSYRDKDSGYSFKATQFDVVNVSQTGLSLLGEKLGATHVEGWGINNKGQTVPFVLDLVDNGGDGSTDTYSFTTGDGYSAQGTPSTGKNKYGDGETW